MALGYSWAEMSRNKRQAKANVKIQPLPWAVAAITG
jgi:hypothetical protein